MNDGKKRLVDFLNEWAQVFHYRGDFRGFTELLLDHKELAESIQDKARLGIYYGWLGFALFGAGKVRDSYEYSSKALKLGEEIGSYPIIGLAFCQSNLGLRRIETAGPGHSIWQRGREDRQNFTSWSP